MGHCDNAVTLHVERSIIPMKQNELRQELLATLAAGRELPGDTDEYLVDGLLARLEPVEPAPHRLEELRALYDAVIPVKPSTVARIAAAQGVVLFVLAKLIIIDGFWSIILQNYGSSTLMWETFAVIWLVEVIMTVAVVAAVGWRQESRASDHRKRRIRNA